MSFRLCASLSMSACFPTGRLFSETSKVWELSWELGVQGATSLGLRV